MSAEPRSATVFASEHIHQKWISEYRNNKLQDAFNDKLMERLLIAISLPTNALVLDAGCGTGEHSVRLGYHKLNVIGVDVSLSVLETARSTASTRGLNSLDFVQGDLTDLTQFPDGTFDAVHCRGVLMHVPQWEEALRELCRVLKPLGHIAIFEGNHRSLELSLVRLLRLFRKSRSKIVKTQGGIEFHPESKSSHPMTRAANINYLVERLEQSGVSEVTRTASEFWDIARWPQGPLRDLVIRFNQAWFSFNLPAKFSHGNLIVGRKRP